MSVLTTNDVRVLRLLLERGGHTSHEILRTFARTGAGGEVAVRRLPSLRNRALVEGHPLIDVTGEGARQLRRADEAAYGRFA